MDYVEVARSDSVRGELVLRRRRDADLDPDGGPGVLELRANGLFVMDSDEHVSEAALADAALSLVERPRRVLVGGLGLGFTLERVLEDGRVDECVTAEIEPALVGWMCDGTIPHGPRLLADRRARVVVADVAEVVSDAAPASYDVILLDVDNGPDNLVHQHNAALYRLPFLRAVHGALRPGAAVAFWSAASAPVLAEALGAVFDVVAEVGHSVRLQRREERYWLYVGRRG